MLITQGLDASQLSLLTQGLQFFSLEPPVPPEQIWQIPAENRVWRILSEDRVWRVSR